MNRPIALITDFGAREPYVGMMKSVALSIFPRAVFIDLTHEVAPQAVQEAALSLDQCADFLPPASICVCVVDPGVGSGRRILSAKRGSRIFLAPDNGLLSPLLSRLQRFEVREVVHPKLALRRVSKTFEARDRFAVIAAYLAKGFPFAKLGPHVKRFEQLSLPVAVRRGSVWRGQVLHIDRFGNAITNLPAVALEKPKKLCVRRRVIRRFVSHYQEGGAAPFALVNSSGKVEIALFQGSVAKRLGLAVGHAVALECR